MFCVGRLVCGSGGDVVSVFVEAKNKTDNFLSNYYYYLGCHARFDIIASSIFFFTFFFAVAAHTGHWFSSLPCIWFFKINFSFVLLGLLIMYLNYLYSTYIYLVLKSVFFSLKIMQRLIKYSVQCLLWVKLYKKHKTNSTGISCNYK